LDEIKEKVEGQALRHLMSLENQFKSSRDDVDQFFVKKVDELKLQKNMKL